MDILKSALVWAIAVLFLVILFPVTFIIWLILLPFDRNRVVTHWILVYQGIALSRILPIWRINTEGREKIVKGTTYVIISNHQSILDVLLLNNLPYRYKWISKIENVRVPILGWYLKMADYIIVNRGNEESKLEMLDKSYKCLKKGVSIMIFPEGTRSYDKEIGFFKRGAFQLALQANVPLLPVVLDGSGDVLPKHGLKLGSHYRITIRVLDPVMPNDFSSQNPDILAEDISNLMKAELKLIREMKN
jgi:1-acyl-sn-glycerol-3-phosphate acyltransferase